MERQQTGYSHPAAREIHLIGTMLRKVLEPVVVRHADKELHGIHSTFVGRNGGESGIFPQDSELGINSEVHHLFSECGGP